MTREAVRELFLLAGARHKPVQAPHVLLDRVRSAFCTFQWKVLARAVGSCVVSRLSQKNSIVTKLIDAHRINVG
jgi:hypothetical protein